MTADMQRFVEALGAFEKGEIVVVTDDDDRENEGDLFVAASLCTPEKMGFIIRHTSGIVCAPLSADDAKRLHLDPMVSRNDAPLATAFTVSVDVKHGLTTGISAEQRNNTVRALANGNMGAADFVRPGHVFPLIAKDGGVLMRSGHTEAAVDLCKLADLPPVGVICELANDDGTVMKGAQISAFAEKHGLKQITVADLIAYRQSREKLVELIAAMGITPRGLLREKGTPYTDLGLGDPKWTDDELMDFMLAHPILIDRPIVVTPKGTRLCRPSEAVLDILPNPDIGPFTKEDGKVVIDASGKRVR